MYETGQMCDHEKVVCMQLFSVAFFFGSLFAAGSFFFKVKGIVK